METEQHHSNYDASFPTVLVVPLQSVFLRISFYRWFLDTHSIADTALGAGAVAVKTT